MGFNIKDSSTWRTAKVVSAYASGAWRTAKGVWVNDGGTWRPAWMLNTTVTVAVNGGDTYGFLEGIFGSRSPTTDIAGNTIYKLFYSTASTNTHFEIRGSGMTYAQTTYIKELQIIGGASLSMSSATSFSNNGSAAQWIWGAAGDLLGLSSLEGQTVQVQGRVA